MQFMCGPSSLQNEILETLQQIGYMNDKRKFHGLEAWFKPIKTCAKILHYNQETMDPVRKTRVMPW